VWKKAGKLKVAIICDLYKKNEANNKGANDFLTVAIKSFHSTIIDLSIIHEILIQNTGLN